MRTLRALVLALMLLLVAALAEDADRPLQIHTFVEPQVVLGAGEVHISFVIENRSSEDLGSIVISSANGLETTPIGSLAAGQEMRYEKEHALSEGEIAAGEIRYIISHDAASGLGETINYTVSAPIALGEARADVDFSRSIERTLVPEGEEAIIRYIVRNVGNVALSQIALKDSLGAYEAQIDRLEVGEERQLVNRATLLENTISHAVLSFEAEGVADARQERYLKDVELRIADTRLQHKFELYPSARTDTAQLVLQLQNAGNTRLNNIVVTDALDGGMLMQLPSLPVGTDSVELRRERPIRPDGRFCLRITATSESGERIEQLTDTLQFWSNQDDGPAKLLMQVQVDAPRIRKAGDVTLSLHIQNDGGKDVHALTLSEATLGDVRTFEVLPAHGSISCTLDAHVQQDCSFAFALRYALEDGAIESLEAEPVAVVFASDGVIPKGASKSLIEFSGNSLKVGGSATFATLLIVGISLLIALIVLLAVASRRARKQEQQRRAEAKVRRQASIAKSRRKKE